MKRLTTMKLYTTIYLLVPYIFISLRVLPVLGQSHTYFASKSFQNSIVMNGSGPPISEKKMSAFSVEDHKENDE